MLSVEIIKEVYNFLLESKRLDLAEQITTLRQDMMDVKDENTRLKEQNASLKDQLRLKSKIVFKKGICWIHDDEMTDEDASTPICPMCWQIDETVNRLPIEQWNDSPTIRCPQKGHGLFYIR